MSVRDKKKKKKVSTEEPKKSSKKLSTREKLMLRQKKLKERGGSSNFYTFKEGKTRIRILPVPDDQEQGVEITNFYMGKGMEPMSIISPKSFDEPCPFFELYTKLSKSKKEEDQNLAKRLKPGKKYLVYALVTTDESSKNYDTQRGPQFYMISNGVYDALIDLYLDEESGDFTDPKTGYDVKIVRSGTGKQDTEYKVIACKPTALPKEYAKVVDPVAKVREMILSYDELEELLQKYVNMDPEEEDSDEVKKKPSKDGKKKRSKGNM